MRILHVIANLAPRYGGPSKACVEMAAAVAARGHEVHIFTTDQDGSGILNVPIDRPVMREGVYIHYFHAQIRRVWPVSIPLAKALRDHVRDFDLVHVHSLYLFHGMLAGHYCRKWNVPYLLRPHGTLAPYLYKRHRIRKRFVELLFEERNIRGAAALHFTTDDERRLAEPYIFGAHGVVVPNGLNVASYTNLPELGTFRAAYPEIGQKKIVLFLSRLNFKKGLDILIRAFAIMKEAQSDIHLVIAGPDSDGFESKVRTWVRKEGLDNSVTFTDMLQGEQKLAAFRDANVFVLPSYSENFGIAVVEAMACGVPVVVSDQVNICHDISKSGAGVVVPCDANKCAEGIQFVLDDEARANQMGKRAKSLVNDSFSWSVVAEKLEGVYQEVARKYQFHRTSAPSEPSAKDNGAHK